MYYKHSGRFSIGGLLFGLLTGCAGSLVLAYAYGRGSILIPESHLAAFATVAFGALIGLCTGYGLIWGKVRSQAANFAIQAVASTFGIYLSWAVWVVDIFKKGRAFNHTWTEYASHPAALWRAICFINQYGTWSLEKGDPTRGTELWLLWLAEAATVIGLAMLVGHEVLRNHAFCERCESWCRRGTKLVLSPPPNPAQLKTQLEAKDWRSLENLTAGNKTAEHLEVVLDSCEQCHQLHTMSLMHTSIVRNKLRQPRIRRNVIVRHLLVDPTQAESLRQISMKVSQAALVSTPKTNAAGVGKL